MKLLSEARLSQRSGFTLTEVLMAMFVMAIGMISLLALFPVGFLNARWALDAEQVSRGAANAQAMTEMPRLSVQQVLDPFGLPIVPVVSNTTRSIRNDDKYRPSTSNSSLMWRNVPMGVAGLSQPFFLINTDSSSAAFRTWTFDTNKNSALPGTKVVFPPVFVDPQVADSLIEPGTGLPLHVGANAANLPFANVPFVDSALFRPNRSVGIPRSSLSHLNSILNTVDRDPNGIRRLIETSMGDEVNFSSSGQPELKPATTEYSRQSRFTWAYMCFWPDYQHEDICDISLVIFNSRPSFPATLPQGEVTFGSDPVASGPSGSGLDLAMFGRVFVKGLSQATILLGTSAVPSSLKVGDWVMDSTMILPEYDPANPLIKAPFLDTFVPTPAYPVAAPVLRPGLAGGHFYKVLDVSSVRQTPSGFIQTLTLDRPARSDGFSATVLSGVADVIVKGVGRMPQR